MVDYIAISGGAVELQVTNLAWGDEFAWRERRQSMRRTLDGVSHFREQPLSGARPMTLTGESWVLRPAIEAIQNDADAGGARVVTLYDGRQFSVLWADDPIATDTVLPGLADPDADTLYAIRELRLLILRSL